MGGRSVLWISRSVFCTVSELSNMKALWDIHVTQRSHFWVNSDSKDPCTGHIHSSAFIRHGSNLRPSTDQWLKKKWYLYTIGYYSATKRMKQYHLSNMNGPRGHTKGSQVRQGKANIIRMQNLKYAKMNLFTKQKEIQKHRKQTYGCHRGKGRRERLRSGG